MIYSESTPLKFVYLTFVVSQCVLASGVIFGWSALLSILQRDGVYEEFCNENEILPCTEQKQKLAIIFTVAAAASTISQLPMGIILDRFGPRFTVLMATIFSILGALLFAFSDSKSFDFYIVGFSLIGWMGPAYTSSAANISNLFPNYKATIVSLFPGSFNLGSVLFLVFDLFHQNQIATFRSMMIIYSFVLAIFGIASIWIYPDSPYKLGDKLAIRSSLSDVLPARFHKANNNSSIDYAKLDSKVQLTQQLSILDLKQPQPEEHVELDQTPKEEENVELSEMNNQQQIVETSTKDVPFSMRLYDASTLKAQVISVEYAWLLTFHIITNLRLNFLVGTFNDQMKSTLPPNEANMAITFNSSFLPVGSIFVLIVGRLMDKYGSPSTFALIFSHTILYGLLILIPSLEFAIFTSVVVSAGRAFLFGGWWAYIAKFMGFKRYGKLGGIANFFAGIVNLTGQYGLIWIVYNLFDGSFFFANLMAVGFGMIGIGLPIMLWRRRNRKPIQPL